MKRIVIAVGLIMLLFAVSAVAQTPAPKPGPEHKKMEIWVGNWTFEEEDFATPFAPAGKLSGKAVVKPILGGFFVEFRNESKGTAGPAQYFEVDSYDPLTKKYVWNGFSSDGGIHAVTYTIEGTLVSYSGTLLIGGKQGKIRGTCVFAPDFMSWEEKGEISADGKAWMPRYQTKFTKVKSSPK
jgi:Protein of unknown function (DUF1579)